MELFRRLQCLNLAAQNARKVRVSQKARDLINNIESCMRTIAAKRVGNLRMCWSPTQGVNSKVNCLCESYFCA